MPKKYILITAGVLIAVGLASIFAFRVVRPEPATGELGARLAVVVPHVYLVQADVRTRELGDGETLAPGTVIETDAGGKANLSFADGSIARLDTESRIEIRAASYDPASKRLVAKFFLSAGRVWSKIIELSTSDSAWEVQTSHAVATVRGTAFGTKTGKTSTTIFSSEHTVRVVPVDPKTNEPRDDQGVLVPENTIVDLDKDLVADIAAGRATLDPRAATAGDLQDPWVLGNRAADAGAGASGELNAGAPGAPAGGSAGAVGNVGAGGAVGGAAAGGSVGVNGRAVNAVALDIVPTTQIANIVEGTRVLFTAQAKFSDGTTKDVTKEAVWRVLGPIGSIAVPGVFVALLDPSVAEFGEGSGAIVATWKDPATGTELLGKTPVFKVQAKVIVIPAQG